MNKEELIVELERNDVQVNIDDTRITYCNSLDKELVKAIYNLQQENKQLKARIDKAIESIEKELKENNHLSYGVALSIITILNDGKILKGESDE